MTRAVPLAVLLLLLAAVAFADSLDDVRLRVYAYDLTEEPAVVHVVISREGHVVFDEGAEVAANGSVLVGRMQGPPGAYSWSVLFGRDSAYGSGEMERASGPMEVILLPDGSVEVGVGIA